MASLFVSYASEDKERVADLVAALESLGWEVWWDDDLQPGRRFEADIKTKLEEATAVIVVWSRHSISSDWVNDEAQEAKDKDKIVPVLIDNVLPPLGFRRLQTGNLVEWTGSQFDRQLLDVANDLERLYGVASPRNPKSGRSWYLSSFGTRTSVALYACAATAAAIGGIKLFETTLVCPQTIAFTVFSCETSLQRQLVIPISIAIACFALILRSLATTWNIVADMGNEQFYVRQARARHLSKQAFGHAFLFIIYFVAVSIDMIIYDEGYGATYRSVLLATLDQRRLLPEGTPAPSTQDFMVDMFALVIFGVTSLFSFIYLKRQSVFGELMLVAASLFGTTIGAAYLNYGAPALITDGFVQLRRSYATFLGLMFGVTCVLTIVSVVISRLVKALR